MRDIALFVGGYYIQLFASCLLLYRILSVRSIYGMSHETQFCFLFATICRLIWTFETRLVDTMFAYIELPMSLAMSIALCYYMHKFRHTMPKESPPFLSLPIIVTVGAVLALFFHPGSAWFTMQTLVAFTMYTEALGLVPQLFLMRNMSEVEPLTSHYVALLVVARFIRMCFWFEMYQLGENFFDLLASDLVHTIFAADYFYLWVRKIRSGGRLVYCI